MDFYLDPSSYWYVRFTGEKTKLLLEEILTPCHYQSKIIFLSWRKHSILKIMKWKSNLKVSIIQYVFAKLFVLLPQEWIGSWFMINIFLKVYGPHFKYWNQNQLLSVSSTSLWFVSYFHTGEQKYENFYCLYCWFCETVNLPKIWSR